MPSYFYNGSWFSYDDLFNKMDYCFSYKLWYNYLKGLRLQAKGKCVTDRIYEDINNAFERSLVFMHKVCNYCVK